MSPYPHRDTLDMLRGYPNGVVPGTSVFPIFHWYSERVYGVGLVQATIDEAVTGRFQHQSAEKQEHGHHGGPARMESDGSGGLVLDTTIASNTKADHDKERCHEYVDGNP